MGKSSQGFSGSVPLRDQMAEVKMFMVRILNNTAAYNPICFGMPCIELKSHQCKRTSIFKACRMSPQKAVLEQYGWSHLILSTLGFGKSYWTYWYFTCCISTDQRCLHQHVFLLLIKSSTDPIGSVPRYATKSTSWPSGRGPRFGINPATAMPKSIG